MQTPSSAPHRLGWVDFIRMLGAFGVIVVHVDTRLYRSWGEIPADWWMAVNVYTTLARPFVPIFLMLSGALLLPRPSGKLEFFKRRAFKVILPWLIWSAIYGALFSLRAGGTPGLSDLSVLGRQILANPVVAHLWFFYTIIGLYLFVPVLWVLVRHGSEALLWYLAILWMIGSTLGALLSRFYGNLPLELYFGYATGYLGYFLLGHLLAARDWGRREVTLAAGLFALAAAANILGNYALTSAAGRFDGFLNRYTGPTVMLMALTGFVLLKAWGTRVMPQLSPRAARLVTALGSTTLGVYLIHPLVLVLLDSDFTRRLLGTAISPDTAHPAVMIPLTALACFLICVGLVLLAKRLPVLKWLVP